MLSLTKCCLGLQRGHISSTQGTGNCPEGKWQLTWSTDLIDFLFKWVEKWSAWPAVSGSAYWPYALGHKDSKNSQGTVNSLFFNTTSNNNNSKIIKWNIRIIIRASNRGPHYMPSTTWSIWQHLILWTTPVRYYCFTNFVFHKCDNSGLDLSKVKK